jgi:lycopene beta-cyclase
MGQHGSKYTEAIRRKMYVKQTLPTYDLIIVGGGLSGGLLAYRLRQSRPDVRFLVLEQGSTLGGNHTWSFHHSDLTSDQHDWIDPLVKARWDGYVVKFPQYTRHIHSKYYSVTSTHFHSTLYPLLKEQLILGQRVDSIQPTYVILDNSRKIDAQCVIDARGIYPGKPENIGYQKFVGLDLKLSAPHELQEPVIMDATCDQRNGYRFFYLLPWDERTLLIEDTYYNNDNHLNINAMRENILDYTKSKFGNIETILRTETGVIPIPLVRDHSSKDKSRVPSIGIGGLFFNDTTGYSFSYSVRVADGISKLPKNDLQPELLSHLVQSLHSQNSSQSSYYRLLNRMLFEAAVPQHRVKVFERFYKLPQTLIGHFYSGQLTPLERARILIGKPPVPLIPALKCLLRNPRSKIS